MVAKRKHHLSEYIPRTWKASVRDTSLLLNEFRGPVLFFAIAILGLGTLYYFLAFEFKEPIGSWVEAIYLMLTLTFLQSSGDFPTNQFLQVFFFLMPLVGVGTLAQGLADFGILLFNRRMRNKEWEMAVASTFSNHTVLVGLGHLGYRVASLLYSMGESVVTIELNPSADLFTSVQGMGIPVIQADATQPTALEAAQIVRAKTIILCAQNDSANLQIALKARSYNPKIQVVIRIFDEDFAHALHDQFGFSALSATEMAAPVFAAAAAGMDVTNPISVEGQQLSLARMTISQDSALAGRTVGFVEDNYHLNHSEMHPTDSRVLTSGDMIAILGGPEQLSHLMHDNE
jgi:voltage-gated potassium channel